MWVLAGILKDYGLCNAITWTERWVMHVTYLFLWCPNEQQERFMSSTSTIECCQARTEWCTIMMIISGNEEKKGGYLYPSSSVEKRQHGLQT